MTVDARPTAKELISAHVATARERAVELGGTVGRCSAALSYGWSVKHVPERPEITLPRGRRVDGELLRGLSVRRLDLPPEDIDGWRTVGLRTVFDCLRYLSFSAGLCVADSALRSGIPRQLLDEAAAAARGPGSVRIRFVLAHANGKAANAFESTMRAIALGVPGLHVEPQVAIGGAEFLGTPDLVDVRLRIVIECDSFENHGGADGLARDARRYNAFVVNGWLVLRFTWYEVMFQPERVRAVLLAAVAERSR